MIDTDTIAVDNVLVINDLEVITVESMFEPMLFDTIQSSLPTYNRQKWIDENRIE